MVVLSKIIKGLYALVGAAHLLFLIDIIWIYLHAFVFYSHSISYGNGSPHSEYDFIYMILVTSIPPFFMGAIYSIPFFGIALLLHFIFKWWKKIQVQWGFALITLTIMVTTYQIIGFTFFGDVLDWCFD